MFMSITAARKCSLQSARMFRSAPSATVLWKNSSCPLSRTFWWSTMSRSFSGRHSHYLTFAPDQSYSHFPWAVVVPTTAATSVRSFSRRSYQGYDEAASERDSKVEAQKRQSEFHQEKIDENKKKKEKLLATTGKSHKFDDDDDEEEEKVVDSDHEEEQGESGPVLPDPKKVKERMMKVVSALEMSMQSLRGAEPTPELLESIRVQVYGEFMALGSVAQVVIVSPTLAHVSCFDPSTVQDVRAGLTESALDLNPYVDENDQATLIVPLPRLSLETREKMVQQLHRQAEASRLRIRRLRQKAIDVCNKGKQGKLEHIGKDEAFRIGKEVENITQDAISKLNAKVDQKSKGILQV